MCCSFLRIFFLERMKTTAAKTRVFKLNVCLVPLMTFVACSTAIFRLLHVKFV